jgi:hypothetical protein
MGIGSLTKMSQSDFQNMSRKALRDYVLSHRQDEEALRIYMHRLQTESGVVRHLGGVSEQDFAQLEQIVQTVRDRS